MTDQSGWWRRECGGRDVLAMALPLILSTASWSIMHFVDRMFLFWHSQNEMAAALPSGMLHWTCFAFPIGVASYVNTFVAQYYGAGRLDRIGVAVGQGVVLGWLATPFFLLAIPAAPYLFALWGHTDEMQRLEITYFQVSAFGAGAMVISASQSAFFTGRGVTWVVMLVDIAACALNVLLDYLWIFGLAGFPEMGIAGAAWGTIVSLWAKVLVYFVLMRPPKLRATYGLIAWPGFDFELIRRLFYYGGSSGLQMLIEGSAFTLLILFVARLGEIETAATGIAFTINGVAFIPLVGLGIGVSTLVGQQLGRSRPDLAARATWTALWLGLGYNGLFAAIYIGAPHLFLLGHAAGTNPDDWAEVRELAPVLLRFVAIYCLFDAMQMVFLSAIRGAGDTVFVLATTVTLSLAALIVGQAGVTYFGLGLFWWWYVLTGWICLLGLVYFARFLQGRWRTMRVIEPEFAPPPEPKAECAAG